MVPKVTVTSFLAGLMLALSLIVGPAKQAGAQQNITWSTPFQVQNLGSAEATVTVSLIDRLGNPAATISNEKIAYNSSTTFFLSVKAPQLTTFNGSAIISSDQPVAAILNIHGNNGFYNEAVNGVSEGSTTVNLPLLHRNNAGFNTWFAVQNVGTGPTTVTVAYTAGSINGGAPIGKNYTPPAVSIPQGASVIFDQATETDATLGARFVGSAIVSSDPLNPQPLAVIVNQVGVGTAKESLIYSGFAKGAPKVVLPLVQNGGGWQTGISIQNTGTVPATVTVTYSALVGTNPTTAPLTIAPGGIGIVSLADTTRYVGSAIVETAASNQEVVVVVNQTSSTSGTAYEGIPLSAITGKTTVSVPLLMANNGGYYTGLQCRNAGTAATIVTLTYSTYANPRTGVNFTPPVFTSASINPDGIVNIQQNFGVDAYVGGGKITTNPPVELACVVNELKVGTGTDTFLTYNGINY